MVATSFSALFKGYPFEPVVPFNRNTQRLCRMDFTETNSRLTAEMIMDIQAFSAYVEAEISAAGAVYGIGGYNEHRTLYSRSAVFNGSADAAEPRRLHLGIDIWGAAGTPVSAPMKGTVHSFAFNDQYGDYGATIILEHTWEDLHFHSLYGHLSLRDLHGLYAGKPVSAGEVIAHFGESNENGYWPPHLHFQLIRDMQELKGDYPGVCRYSERKQYLENCPDPAFMLSAHLGNW
ncbi:MAG: peptidoglycan DD-metalloendopeptidase family protein [Chitinophagaceae bacterium]|nr:peptidoglycan DD-metalloendopeptidase family protein [Chitinophagaceae bacterium]